jgi:hypothetical protein
MTFTGYQLKVGKFMAGRRFPANVGLMLIALGVHVAIDFGTLEWPGINWLTRLINYALILHVAAWVGALLCYFVPAPKYWGLYLHCDDPHRVSVHVLSAPHFLPEWVLTAAKAIRALIRKGRHNLTPFVVSNQIARWVPTCLDLSIREIDVQSFLFTEIDKNTGEPALNAVGKRMEQRIRSIKGVMTTVPLPDKTLSRPSELALRIAYRHSWKAAPRHNGKIVLAGFQIKLR